MKKTLFLSALACSMAFYACKKDNDTTKPPVVDPPVDSIVPLIDPVALSANVKIGYGGTSIAGNIPAASTDAAAPVLDPTYDGFTYYAISNRYVVIYPALLSGYAKGYYLQINGSGSSYKIDYKAASGLRKASRPAGQRDPEDNGAADSTIIIKLPAGLKGDTFSIKYAAYDSLNRVSATLSAVVSIIASPNATDDAKLSGSWSLFRERRNYYEKDIWDSSATKGNTEYNTNYYCVDNKLSEEPAEEGDQATVYPYYINYYNSQRFSFAANNAATMSRPYKYTVLDLENSSCGAPVYAIQQEYEYNYTGGYSYNATTKILTFIQDQDGKGSNLYSRKFTVTEMSAGKIVMFETQPSEGHDEIQVHYYDYRTTPKN